VNALSTTGLGLRIGGMDIVRDVDLDVHRGELLAVIGPNGAGKTSLFNLLSGTYRPTAGAITLDGEDVTGTAPYERARKGLARSFQVTSLFPQLTVLENVRLAVQAHAGGSLFLWQRVTQRDPAVTRAREALETVGLERYADQDAASLSHGNKRKLDLVIAVASSPSVLLLDEPTAGMSAEDVFGVIDVVRSITSAGTTIVMVEHRMDLVLDVADRIAVMHHGSLLTVDRPEAVMADATVQSAYLGEPL